jgi:hypothetical protein
MSKSNRAVRIRMVNPIIPSIRCKDLESERKMLKALIKVKTGRRITLATTAKSPTGRIFLFAFIIIQPSR